MHLNTISSTQSNTSRHWSSKGQNRPRYRYNSRRDIDGDSKQAQTEHQSTQNHFIHRYRNTKSITSIRRPRPDPPPNPPNHVFKTTRYYNNAPIKLVYDMESLRSAVHELLTYKVSYLGIDCEWKPQHIKGKRQNKVSLLQIAHQRIIILIRLNKLKNVSDSLLKSGMLKILKDRKIIKCGVGIIKDKTKMYQDHRVNIERCLELNQLNLYPIRSNRPGSYLSLKKLCEKVLKYEMKYKLKRITTSNWERNPLTHEQIMYAAEDAFVSYKILDVLLRNNGCLLPNIDEFMDRKVCDASLEQCRDKMMYIGQHCYRFALNELCMIYIGLLGAAMKKKYKTRLREMVIYFDDIFEFDASSQDVTSKVYQCYRQECRDDDEEEKEDVLPATPSGSEEEEEEEEVLPTTPSGSGDGD